MNNFIDLKPEHSIQIVAHTITLIESIIPFLRPDFSSRAREEGGSFIQAIQDQRIPPGEG